MKPKEFILDDVDKKQKKMDLLNSKISVVLPELMSRNIKLGERLKNKLKVSTLFNNIEHRNKKYLKGFIFSSNKRAKDLKTGLDMNKAVKQSAKKLTLLCNQMKNDLILKNSDILLKEKKLLSENTEQETHKKINDFLHTIKEAIKPPTSLGTTKNKKLIKSMSEDEILKAKNILSNKIIKEENDIKQIINNYLTKMRSSFDNNSYEMNKIKIKKDFNKYTDNMYLAGNMKLINYSRAKPQQIKDKESANLVRIKKFLYPSNFDLKELRENQKNYNALKRNSSMNDIYNSKSQNLKDRISTDGKLKTVDVTGKDTMEVLNNLVDQGEYLSERLNDKLEKVNSLIETNLPFPSNYELVLNYIKKHPNLRKYDNDNKRKGYLSPISNDNINKKVKITPYMRSRLLSIKEDIEKKTEEFLENNLNNSKVLPKINNYKPSSPYSKIISDKSIVNKSSDNIESTNSFDAKSDTVFITSKKNNF